jgi:hypothetical protein
VKRLEANFHGSYHSARPVQSETHTNETIRATINQVFGENLVNVDDVADISSKDDGMEVEMVNDVYKWSKSPDIGAEVAALKPFNEDPFVPTDWLQTDASTAEVVASIPIP